MREPDRLPDPTDVIQGRIGVNEEGVCTCGHGVSAHNENGDCLLCGCQRYQERK